MTWGDPTWRLSGDGARLHVVDLDNHEAVAGDEDGDPHRHPEPLAGRHRGLAWGSSWQRAWTGKVALLSPFGSQAQLGNAIEPEERTRYVVWDISVVEGGSFS